MNLLPMPFIRTNHAEARRYSAYSVFAVPNPTHEYYITWSAVRKPLQRNIKRMIFCNFLFVRSEFVSSISSRFAHASRNWKPPVAPPKRKLQAVVLALRAVHRACVNMQERRVTVAVAHIDAATDGADKADDQKRGCFLLRRVCNFNLHGAPSCTARFCDPALHTAHSSPL